MNKNSNEILKILKAMKKYLELTTIVNTSTDCFFYEVTSKATIELYDKIKKLISKIEKKNIKMKIPEESALEDNR